MKLYCVVGMHRSGTSAVSGILNILGASLGPAADLMGPKEDNPAGFWESRSITQLHDDLLGQLGGRWDNPRWHDDGWELAPNLEPFRNRIRQLISTHFDGADVAVWKDPRGSLLLPIWRSVTPIAGSIITLRDPSAVAASLALRQNIGVEKAAYLWLRYTGTARRADPGHFIVSYGDLISDPGRVATQLAAFVGLPAPNEGKLDQIRAFVRPDLCHQHGHGPVVGTYLNLAHALFSIMIPQQPHVIGPFVDLLHDRWKAMQMLDMVGVQSRRLVGEFLPHD